MSVFKAKMHQIRFTLRLRPRHCWRSLQCSTDHLAVFKRPTFKGREGKEIEGKVKEKKGRGGQAVEGAIWSTQKFWRGAPMDLGLYRPQQPSTALL